MPATPDQQKKNLATTREIIARRLGVDPSNLTFEQRYAYNREFAQFIVDRPTEFSETSLNSAREILAQPAFQPLADTSFDFSAAIPDIADKVEKKLTMFVVVAIVAVAAFVFLPRSLAALKTAK